MKLDFTSTPLTPGCRCHFTLSMTRIGERAPHRWRSTRLEERSRWSLLARARAMDYLPGLLSGSDPGSSSGDGGGSGSGRGGIGVGSSGRGCGGCWGMGSLDCAGVRMVQQSACPTEVHPTRPSTSANTNVGRLLACAASPFLQPGSRNSTNRRRSPGNCLDKRLSTRLFRLGTRLVRENRRR